MLVREWRSPVFVFMQKRKERVKESPVHKEKPMGMEGEMQILTEASGMVNAQSALLALPLCGAHSCASSLGHFPESESGQRTSAPILHLGIRTDSGDRDV